jgi:hypothetical protein
MTTERERERERVLTRLRLHSSRREISEKELYDDISEAHRLGLSWRAIGAAAGISHEQARRILKRKVRS